MTHSLRQPCFLVYRAVGCVCVRDCVLKDVCLSYTTGKVQYVFNSVNSCSSTDASQKARSQLVITATVIRGLFPAEAFKERTDFLSRLFCLFDFFGPKMCTSITSSRFFYFALQVFQDKRRNMCINRCVYFM